MAKHIPRPPFINRAQSNIGSPPLSSHAETLRGLSMYLRNQFGQGQVYSYSGPGPGTYDSYNPDYNYYEQTGEYAEFPIILHNPPKVDTSQSYRQLAGVILPWRSVPRYYGEQYIDRPVKVTWKHLYNSQTVYRHLYRSNNAWPSNWSSITGFTGVDIGGAISLYNYNTQNLFADYDNRFSISGLLWGSGNGATLSKDTTYYQNGTQSLKVTCTGTANPYAAGPFVNYLAQMTTGCDYTMSIWAKGDGSAYPVIKCGATTLATGTTSTTWQLLTANFTASDDRLHLQATTSTSSQYCNFDNLQIAERGKFRYEPDSSGEFSVGFLRVERMKVAALSIFTAPDSSFTDAEAVVTDTNIAAGRAIRGYTGTGIGSIGNIQYMAGAGGSSYDVDDVERVTRKALICSGHPMGLHTTTYASYTNIRGGDASYFKVMPRNLLGKANGTNVSTIPVLYGYCQGAAVGNEAYVKYTSLTSTDTWEYEINSDSPAIWGDMSTLDVNATGDYVKIEVKAPPNGYMVMQAYYLYEDSYDS